MSLIASFYLVPADRGEQLVAAAEAQHAALNKKRWGIFRPKLPLDHDPFWDYLQAQARELETFPYGGNVLVDAELLAPDVFAFRHALGERISRVTGDTWMSYTPADAAGSIDMLARADFSPAAIAEALRHEAREDDIPGYAAVIEDARNRLVDWFRQVSGSELGLLSIG